MLQKDLLLLDRIGYLTRLIITVVILYFGIKTLTVHSIYWPGNQGQIDLTGIVKWLVISIVFSALLAIIFSGFEFFIRRIFKMVLTKRIIVLNIWAAINFSFFVSLWIVPQVM